MYFSLPVSLISFDKAALRKEKRVESGTDDGIVWDYEEEMTFMLPQRARKRGELSGTLNRVLRALPEDVEAAVIESIGGYLQQVYASGREMLNCRRSRSIGLFMYEVSACLVLFFCERVTFLQVAGKAGQVAALQPAALKPAEPEDLLQKTAFLEEIQQVLPMMPLQPQALQPLPLLPSSMEEPADLLQKTAFL
jgi:hypothetical protein